MQSKRWLIPAIALLAFAALPVRALPPDQESLDLIARLGALQIQLESRETGQTGATGQTNAALIGAAGIGGYADPGAFSFATPAAPPAALARVEISRLNMRLALTSLSQAYGADDNFAVVAAQTGIGEQTTDSQALFIGQGDATLADLRAAAGQADGTGPLTLLVPLIVMAGASLSLAPGEELRLSRADGAFVVNFGYLSVQGATVAATSEVNTAVRSFRPFVTTAEGGTVRLSGARIVGLGFGQTVKFSGFSVLRSVLTSPDRPSLIENTTFEDLLTVAVSGDTDILLRGNRFRDMRSAALTLSRTDGARVLSNLFFGHMTTNAIRLQDGSARALIAGNVILGGERAGIVVRGNSTGAVVAHNVVWDRGGAGIALLNSACGLIADNLVIDNDQKGIEVRSSPAASLRQNTIFSNESAGIWISNQPDGAQTVVAGNVIAFNGAGLAGARTARILMDGNDFSRQYQQFLSGDLALQTEAVARQMTGGAPFVLDSGVAAAFDPAQQTQATVCSD